MRRPSLYRPVDLLKNVSPYGKCAELLKSAGLSIMSLPVSVVESPKPSAEVKVGHEAPGPMEVEVVVLLLGPRVVSASLKVGIRDPATTSGTQVYSAAMVSSTTRSTSHLIEATMFFVENGGVKHFDKQCGGDKEEEEVIGVAMNDQCVVGTTYCNLYRFHVP